MITTQEQEYLTVNRLQTDPVFFSKEILRAELWGKQKEVIESVRINKRTTVRSCHGAGKSFVAARTILWFLYSFPKSKVITTAPSYRQVKDILWREIRKAYHNSRFLLEGEITETKINIADDWFALGISTDQPDRFQGFHAINILLVVDEASGVKEDIFEAAEGIVSSENAKVLLIGNPINLTGTFYDSFKADTYNRIHVSAFDTPNFIAYNITLDDIKNNTWREKINGLLPAPYLVTPEWVYDKYIQWTPESPMWASRVIGDFPQQGEDTLIPLNKIEDAVNKDIPVDELLKERIGVDIARFGSDKTIFLRKKGNKVLEIKEHINMDTMAVAQVLSIYINTHPGAEVLIDEIGIGAGVLDRIRQVCPMRDIEGINVGMEAHDAGMFANKRAEIYWGLREMFMQGDISIPDDEELINQLANIKFSYSPKGSIIIESKEEMKKRGLHSPDKADALSLTLCSTVKKQNLLEYMSQFKKV
jgi:phage terminase large subunit